ncbi:hypothetical protein [Algibacter mikhailovii]|uniref:Electron transporter RnfD n=1 Tax=Algibacter mikhailovii TaxID=425498 RepID=A0A918R5K0_9FLAO|nr:hypothetical protein [Algibacter mikhailovii]GGZ86102.1 hypothetical protein GCM10007028_25510 [Algibacter mikhailovii]
MFKRTVWDRGTTNFYGFKITGEVAPIINKTTSRKKKIELYGNSITQGLAVDDPLLSDDRDPKYENNYHSYTSIVGGNYKAEYRNICLSGIGLTISWFPLIMHQMFNSLNPNIAGSAWDFSKFSPDLVIINILQNDSWLISSPNSIEFIEAYKKFISYPRRIYPETHIICMLGNMDASRVGSIWPSYIKEAVVQLNDTKIYSHIVPFKNTSGHPSISEQECMANNLINFIDANIIW